MSCDDYSIRVQNVSKFFEIYEKPAHRLWQMLRRGKHKYYREFWALSEISFAVKRGECVGIIGRNGAGKSTLLQIITGTLTPSVGEVEIKGRVAALLELGSGFNPEFTGRENVFLNASILGLTEQQIKAKFADIEAFADIGEFIDQPVKSYSSGMAVRLAFAVIAHVEADVLIIDEALAVGDAFFTQKCMRFLRNFMEKNTVVFVSHDTGSINSLCNRAILLDHGNLMMLGDPKEVTEKYLETIYETMQGKSELSAEPSQEFADSKAEIDLNYQDLRQNFINASTLRNDIEVFQFDEKAAAFGKGGAGIEYVQIVDLTNKPLAWIVGGEMVKVRITIKAKQLITGPIVGFMVRNRLGQDVFGENTYLSYHDQPLILQAGQIAVAEFTFRMPILMVGDYVVNAAVAEGTQHEHVQHHWVHEALLLRSQTTSCTTGLVGIPMQDIKFTVTN